MFRRVLSAVPSSVRCRSLASSTVPSEHDIIRAFRTADFHTAIRLFARRPASQRSDALHEAAILACAQVPDAAAAQAVLKAMPHPTLPAVASVVTALCRERDVQAAVDVLARVGATGLPVDDRLVATVSRAAERVGLSDVVVPRLRRLSSGAPRPGASARPLSAVGFFVEYGMPVPRWPRPPARRRQLDLRALLAAERDLRAARGDLEQASVIWSGILENASLRTEVGVLSAAVDAFLSCGRAGATHAVNAVMTWVKDELHSDNDDDDDENREHRAVSAHVANPSSMALLVTAVCKTLAIAAPTEPYLSLSAYDALARMRLPGFVGSLPLTGAYFKVLQHAGLSLGETRERIETAREDHIQLDEQAFSMGLGAILRCDARVIDKLEEARKWIAIMHDAAIPLTVHTFNLFAGQLRYCNDPTLITSLLDDMTQADVVPTTVTYGLIFSACVIAGDYDSSSRKSALPVESWVQVLQAMEEHMHSCGVLHTSYSLLSLARAYAHLGEVTRAMKEFKAFLIFYGGADQANPTKSDEQLQAAFTQMIYNFAHSRKCSTEGLETALVLHDDMKQLGFPTTGGILDSLLVACVRMGRADLVVQLANEHSTRSNDHRIGISGLRHLFQALTELRDPDCWESTRYIIEANKDLIGLPKLRASVEDVVLSYARSQRRDICEDIMALSGVRVADLDIVMEGRPFMRFRKQALRRTGKVVASDMTPVRDPQGKEGTEVAAVRSSGIHTSSLSSEPFLPLA